MVTLTRNDGQKIVVNDIEVYKKSLESIILKYQKLSRMRKLTSEEENELEDNKYLYNQIIDFLDTYEDDLEDVVKNTK